MPFIYIMYVQVYAIYQPSFSHVNAIHAIIQSCHFAMKMPSKSATIWPWFVPSKFFASRVGSSSVLVGVAPHGHHPLLWQVQTCRDLQQVRDDVLELALSAARRLRF